MISRIRCPGCEDTFKIDTDLAGELAACGSCGGELRMDAAIKSAWKEKRAGAIRLAIGDGTVLALAAVMGSPGIGTVILASLIAVPVRFILILHRRTRFGWCILGDIALVGAGLHILVFLWWLCS